MTTAPPAPPAEHVETAMQIADSVARQLHVRLGREVPLDELLSLARSAALSAAQRWDGRGVFARYSMQRIRWGVIDELRRERGRKRPQGSGAVERTVQLAAERAADTAFLDEVQEAEPDGVDAAMQAFLGRGAAAAAVDLDGAGLLLSAPSGEDVEANVDRLRLRRAVDGLPEAERGVVMRHGYQGQTFEEIAGADRVSRATVFARYASALEKLRRAFDS